MKTNVLYPLFMGILLGVNPVLLALQTDVPHALPAKQVSAQQLEAQAPATAPVQKTATVPLEAPTPVQAVAIAQLVPERAQQILDFWFGTLADPSTYPSEKAATWSGVNAETDRIIREQFSLDVQQAASGELNDWRTTPKGRLALIILLDQFPRHLFRNTPQSMALDAMARGLAMEGVQKGDDKKLYPLERAFFYLPFQHAEDAGFQTLSVAYYSQLVEQSPDIIKPHMQQFLNFALLHQQNIARFGRFPHRNAILGRDSTPEERVYLSQRGSSLF
ncbi:Conserved hypothetical membrane protein [Candidatus Protochlamydia naegleriophila]|uniref:Conserved hypothetical membrane protein n=1 Tax=Candidatus Protochlamydia naegleriophila TaxID=389348 RepID=A0A0U5JGC7_9BACT|nr:DUF924 family protein [Candidatus Protochlamydia naegleriophila]CUI16965.1 Conserved hypothetical membrane protein [Candidatus Protochlamydia naegleriophila]